MSQTAPTAVDALPIPPSIARPSTFESESDAWVAAHPNYRSQLNSLASVTYDNSVDAYNSALSAFLAKNAAYQSEQNAANTASAIAASAAAIADAAAWVSGANYSAGNAAYSLINYKTYRRRTPGAGTNDPARDIVNWAPLAGGGIKTYSGVIDPDSYNAFVATPGSVALPDLTTVSSSFGLCALSNGQAVPATVTTSDGWSITTGFSAGTMKKIAPLAIATPHGHWGNLVMTPPVNSRAESGSGAGANPPLCSVALSATLHVAVFYDSANAYFVAYDPTTGLSGAVVPVALANIAQPASAIYATSSTSFVAFLATNGGGSVAVAGTVAGTAISMGGSRVFASYFVDTPVQLSASTYLCAIGAANDLIALTATGTTTAVGTAVASGNPFTGISDVIAPISATTALVAFPTSSTGPSTITFRVATITGTAIALGAPSATATAICRGANSGPGPSIFSLAAGGPYLFCGLDSTITSTGNFYGVTISGTAVSVGAVSIQASIGWGGTYKRATFATDSTLSTLGKTAKTVDASRCLIAYGGNIYAIIFSGTALTFGAPYALTGVAALMSDVIGSGNIYAVGSASYAKLSISGTTITAASTIGVAPSVIYSETLTDKAVSYSGTWYSWVGLPAAALAVSPSKYLSTASWPTINFYGNFS